MDYAVIGTGYWGSNHVRVAAELLEEGQIDSLTLCDTDESRVAEVADSYGVPYVTDHRELAEEGVDATTLAAPSTVHHELAIDLIDAGLDVLVEKPLALNSDDAWEIVGAAQEADRTLGVGHIFRYHPALTELKTRIDRGEFGDIRYLNTNRFSFRVPRRTAGVLYSLAIHDIDIYTYLMDQKPERIYCETNSFIRSDIDETATLVLDFGEPHGVINESWQVPVFGKRRDIVVVGSEKVAYLDYLEDTKLEVYDFRVVQRETGLTAREEGSHVYETEDAEPLRVEIQEFIQACAGGSAPRATGRIGAEAIELLERAEKSAAKNKTVKI